MNYNKKQMEIKNKGERNREKKIFLVIKKYINIKRFQAKHELNLQFLICNSSFKKYIKI